MERTFFVSGLILAGLGVLAGGIGAHVMASRLGMDLLGIFETAIRYQMYHGLCLMSLAWAMSRWPERQLHEPAWFLLVGTVVFSGSLYVYVLTGIRIFAWITPFGGTVLIAGWLIATWRLIVPRKVA